MTAPVSNHNVVLYINSTIRTSLLKADSLYIRHSATNDIAVADFTLLGDSYTPNGWDTVTIIVDSVIVFGGFITNKNAVTVGSGSTKQTNWQVQCKDWSVLLDIVVISEKYTQQPDYLIINDIFSTYLATEDFAYGTTVAAVKNDIDIAFDKVTIRQALNQLADVAGATWYIGPDQYLYWNSNTGFGAGAFNIDTDAPNNSTSFDVAFGSITRTVDESQIVNRVTVYGGESASGAKQTDTFAANGSKFSFGPLTQSVSAMWSVTYTVGGVANTVYATNIGYAPYGTLSADGGSYTVLVDLTTGTLKIKSAGGAVPDNGTNVVVSYYTSTPVETVVEDTASQSTYGRVFHRKIYDETITSVEAATNYAQRVLDQYSTARETVTFTTYRHGLLPGTLITIRCDKLGLTSPPASYMIQEVEIHPVMSQKDGFMMVARVTCGDKRHTILDVIRQAASASTSNGSGVTPIPSYNGNLSNISSNLGEVISGRALFTNGGTARFSWSNYAGHTGVVVGLEDINQNTYGATYILDAGTMQAKLGRMTGLPAIGTITPSGWGLYTTNGYFKGIVAAGTVEGSYIHGGTVTGSLISGGTVSGGLVTGGTVSGAQVTGGTITGAVGNIGGFVIAANQLYSNGGTISTGSVVNSSNPGVWMGTAGLFGYGTLGLTFALYSDPAMAPWFSSGTINNAVYEVYESAVIRTNDDVFSYGGIQIDNSGIFGVSPAFGALRLLQEDGSFLETEDGRTMVASGVNFMLDATTGNMWAENAFLSGTVYADAGVFTGTVFASAGSFTGTVYASDGSFTGTVNASAGVFNGTVFASAGSFAGTINASAGSFTGAISASTISGGTVTGARISGGTVSGGMVTGGTITGATVTAGTVSGGTVTGAIITAGTVSGGTVSGAYITGGTVVAGGGSITLDSTGFVLQARNSVVTQPGVSDLRFVYSGTVLGYMSSYTSAGLNFVRIDSGYSHGATPINPSYLLLNTWGTGLADINTLTMTVGSASINSDWHPFASHTFFLGGTTSAWRALFLSDGIDEWKITINSSGNLITTKV